MKRLSPKVQHTLFQLFLQLQAKRQPEGGYIIVVVMAMVLVFSSMLITAALTSKVDTNSGKSSANSATGFYAAEAGLNLRARDIRATFEGYNRPRGISPSNWLACRDTDGSNNGTLAFACDNSRTFQGQPVSTFVLEDSNNPVSVTINQGEQFAGLLAQEYRYDVTSVAFDKQNQPTASLQMRFKSRLVPLFQFAVFYEQDLDFSIPPAMTMNGPMHSNGNMYLNASGTLTISGQVTTAGQLFRGERLSNGCNGTVTIFDPRPSPGTDRALACGKKEYIQSELTDWDNQIRVGIPRLTVPAISEFDALPGREYWDKADLRIALVLDSSENVTGIEVQNADGTKNTTATNALSGDTCAPNKTTLTSAKTATDTSLQFADASPFYLYDSTRQAKDGPAVQIDTGTTPDFDANVLTNAVSASGNTLTIKKQLGSAPANATVVRKATVWTSDTFWNYREKAGGSGRETASQIRMLNVDIQALMTCANQIMGGKNIDESSDGGLVWFFTVKGPNSNNDAQAAGAVSNKYGVRIYNGSALDSYNNSHPDIQGLSVVTDQAIYVRGDYNSINKKPAAIMADTINVLSNNWPLDDSYSRRYNSSGIQGDATYITTFDPPTGYGGDSEREASNTEIYAAFLSGIDLTGGGVNNYPRLHEDWRRLSGYNFATSTLKYRGSMVSLGLPRRVNGPFCGSGSTNAECNIYNPPTRNWTYDTDFNNAENLPPLTPRFVYLRQERFSRDFNRQAALPFPRAMSSLFSSNFGSMLPASGNRLFRF